MSRFARHALTTLPMALLLACCGSASVINNADAVVSDVGFVSTEEGVELPPDLRAAAIGFEGSWQEYRAVEPLPASLVSDALPFAEVVVAVFGNTCQPSVELSQDEADELFIAVRDGDTGACGDTGVFWLMGMDADPGLKFYGVDSRKSP